MEANTDFSASLAACIRLNYTINLTDETDYLCKCHVNPTRGKIQLQRLIALNCSFRIQHRHLGLWRNRRWHVRGLPRHAPATIPQDLSPWIPWQLQVQRWYRRIRIPCQRSTGIWSPLPTQRRHRDGRHGHDEQCLQGLFIRVARSHRWNQDQYYQ